MTVWIGPCYICALSCSCNRPILLSSPQSTCSHWTICLCWVPRCKDNWSWSWMVLRYYQPTLGGDCSQYDWPMVRAYTMWNIELFAQIAITLRPISVQNVHIFTNLVTRDHVNNLIKLSFPIMLDLWESFMSIAGYLLGFPLLISYGCSILKLRQPQLRICSSMSNASNVETVLRICFIAHLGILATMPLWLEDNTLETVMQFMLYSLQYVASYTQCCIQSWHVSWIPSLSHIYYDYQIGQKVLINEIPLKKTKIKSL